MKPIHLLSLLIFAHQAAAVPLPEPRPVKTDYFGTIIEDPYRYFEDKNQPEVASWARAISDATLEKLGKLPDEQSQRSRKPSVPR